MRRLPFLLLLAAAGCGDARFERLADALSPWPEFGSSRRLTEAAGPLAPSTGLTRRRVADDANPGAGPDAAPDASARPPGPDDAEAPIRPEPGNVWPAAEERQNTLADFERSLRDGTVPPAPPRNAVP